MHEREAGSRRHKVFDALSDPTRRAIVERLSASPESSISDLARDFPISRQAVTKHLAVLEAAGVIAIEPRGRERIITLRPGALSSASAWLDDIERQWDDRLEALRRHLND